MAVCGAVPGRADGTAVDACTVAVEGAVRDGAVADVYIDVCDVQYDTAVDAPVARAAVPCVLVCTDAVVVDNRGNVAKL